MDRRGGKIGILSQVRVAHVYSSTISVMQEGGRPGVKQMGEGDVTDRRIHLEKIRREGYPRFEAPAVNENHYLILLYSIFQ